MPKPKWKARELLYVVPSDKPGIEIRVYLKTWQDDSRCVELQKWARNEAGKVTPYWPLQMLQISTDVYKTTIAAFDAARLMLEPPHA
jgi:hypothetical protein